MQNYEEIINEYLSNLEKYILDILVSLGYGKIVSKTSVTNIYKNDDVYTVHIIVTNSPNLYEILDHMKLINTFKDNITNIFMGLNPNIPVQLTIETIQLEQLARTRYVVLKFDLNNISTFEDLPHDVVKLMMKDWSYNEILNVCNTTSTLALLCNDEHFWRQKLLEKITKIDIDNIWKGSNMKTFKYYDKIMNSKYASLHVIDKIFGNQIPMINDYQILNLITIPLIQNGDLIYLRTTDNDNIYMIYKNGNIMKLVYSKYIIPKYFPYPKFKLGYWDKYKINIIGSYTYIPPFEKDVMYFDVKIVNNLEYYGYTTSIYKKFGDKHETIYAKFEYNNETYVIFINNPEINYIKQNKMPRKLDIYKTFDKVRDINKFDDIERARYGNKDFNLLKQFREDVVKKYNVKLGNYTRVAY